MIDNETKEILELAAYLVTVGEGLTRFGKYIAAKVKKRSRSSPKPSKRRNRRKRQ